MKGDHFCSKLQSNLSTMATLETEESGLIVEIEVAVSGGVTPRGGYSHIWAI